MGCRLQFGMPQAQAAFQPVFTSLLETDLYKFSMLQALLHAYPANQAVYQFHCRNKPAWPLEQASLSSRRG